MATTRVADCRGARFRAAGGRACWKPPRFARLSRRPTAAPASASSASTQNAGLVFPLGEAGAWDSGALARAVVRVFPDTDDDGQPSNRWLMWYTGRGEEARAHPSDALFSPHGQIGVAVSSDGIQWQRAPGAVRGDRSGSDVGMCLSANDGEWWTFDTRSVAVGDVQMFSSGSPGSAGVYWMFYTGTDFHEGPMPPGVPGVSDTPDTEGLTARLGLAMSQDGRNWARIEGPHHTHALLDDQEADASAQSDQLAADPCVVARGPGDMLLFYHCYDAAQQRFHVSTATSEGGLRWDPQGLVLAGGEQGSFDERGARSPCVVRDLDSRRFLLFYEAVDASGRSSIGLAYSEDGRGPWQRVDTPVLVASEETGAWDCGGVRAPYAVQMAGDKWRLYYAGVGADGVCGGIGVALSEGLQAGLPARFERRVPRTAGSA